jgi:hypothetical protein
MGRVIFKSMEVRDVGENATWLAITDAVNSRVRSHVSGDRRHAAQSADACASSLNRASRSDSDLPAQCDRLGSGQANKS